MNEYKFGLVEDCAMKILVKTFKTKREAQRYFRENGFTKDSEVWIERVPEDAKGELDK